MLDALRYLRAAVGDFYFELPRMVLLNFFWFVTALPAMLVLFTMASVVRGDAPVPTPPLATLVLYAVVMLPLTLLLAGPGTAGVYYVTNRFANGELLEATQFWRGFRKFFWRGWRLALLDVAAGALLALNVWFYWRQDQPLLLLLSVVFAYILAMWFAIQGYLFSLLVELDQAVRLVIRNALFLAIDNLGLTLGLLLVNLLLVALIPMTALVLLPFCFMAITSNINNRAVVDAIARYRAAGRIFSAEGERRGKNGNT